MTRLCILIVEDDLMLAKSMGEYLYGRGYTIQGCVTSGEEAISLMLDKPADILIMDIHLKGTLDGVETAKKILKKITIPIIYCTGVEDEDVFKRAKTTFPKNYLTKPFSMAQLGIAIDLALVDNERVTNKDEVLLREIHNKFVFIYFRDGGYQKVTVDDICIIEADGPYSKVFLTGKKTPLMIAISSNNVIKKLKSPYLKKVHKSFYINITKVDAIDSKSVIIENIRIPIGASFYKDTIKHFNILKR